MKNRSVFCLLLLALFAATTTRASTHPNILVIVSDDQGYADAGFQGSTEIPTPNLDQLAASGIRFTNAYTSFQFCSPSRAGLLTGRYPQRFGQYRNPLYDRSSHEQGLPISEKLLPEYLVTAGYKTGWIGKWHLGAAPEFTPEQRGFQETYGFLGGRHQYMNWEPDIALEDREPLYRKNVDDMFGNFVNGFYFANRKIYRGIKPPEHMTIAQGQEAAAFVRKHQSEPWFLYLAFNAPHTPSDPTPERLAQFSSIADPARRAYVAQVSLMDDAIGETLAALHDTGQRERTLIIFFTDNGGATGQNGVADNAPLRRGKGSLYEGGVRVPYLVSWPAHLPAGVMDERFVSTLDVFATSLGVAGVAMPTDKKYDSVDLIPFLNGDKSGAPHERLFWGDDGRYAVREGKWKMLSSTGGLLELYNLEKDIGEARDVSVAHPDITAHLAAEVEQWRKGLVAPVFVGEDSTRDRKPKNN